jgi:two-component system CheB/CheR fusion protein
MFNAERYLESILPPEESGDSSFPIVGIGASAGGLEAFTQLLKHLPPTTGMAYVFVQHLDPSHHSILPDLLARVTKMSVCVAQDQMMVEPDHVYVIPPNADLTLEQGRLRLLPRTAQGGQHLTIDRFFRSLALDRSRQAIGVLLSGTAFDGTAGLQAIKAQGGMTFAQNEQSAAYPQMPQHAIVAECVDRVLSPEEIAQALIPLAEHPYLTTSFAVEPRSLSPVEELAFKRICLLLSNATNVDFLAYRLAPLQRRIFRRMTIVQIDRLLTYATYLEGHPAEVEALSQEVLIHVTSFFRDASTFEAVTCLVFPELVQHLLPGDPIRIWIAGCSTGEEVYSLAILLLEFLAEHALVLPFQLFATDIDAVALKHARAGIYQRKTLQTVSPERLERFFLPLDRNGERYQISKDIREHCVFAQHNVAHDPPFSRLDLVSCRNVLIYLTPAGQEKVLQTLHYALKPHGFLLLGASESVGPDSALFTRVEQHQKLFTKKSWERVLSLHMTRDGDEPAMSIREESVKKGAEHGLHEFGSQQEADHLLLTTYAPACVVVDADMQILSLRGHTSPYLEPAPGKVNFHVLKWAREGLKLGLRTAIHAAQKEECSIVRGGLQVSGTTRTVQITVVPLKASSMIPTFLILFEEGLPLANEVSEPLFSRSQSGRRARRTAAEIRIGALEQELATNQAEVQDMLETHDKARAYLQAANEEIRSSNEELQSINEELETSQAELQAINEELTTVNQELQTRNEQLRIAQDYAESIVETIREPLVVLNTDMQIQSANIAFYQFFRVIPAQVEQHALWELDNGQWDCQELRSLLEELRVMNQSFHDFEVEQDFPTIGHKIMLLNGRTIVNEIKGARNRLILLAMEDVTARKEVERQKEALLDIVSHELANPLTSVKFSVQLLQMRLKKAGDEQTATELGKIDAYLNKFSYLIGSLFDASTLKTGMLSIHPTVFVVEDLVQEIVKEQRQIWPERLFLEGNMQIEVYADRERTGQVLRNLLVNALKYSASSDPVWVRASIHENMLTLSIQNRGVGIPQDQQARIFERFVRVEQPEQDRVQGIGLGLYIAAQIVTQQGGRIWVESMPGEGATFFFTVPLAP